MIPTVLTIAGSDPSGGAGIQADLKTFSALKVYGMAVISGLTAQNTRGVFSAVEVSPAFLAEQIDAIASDIPPMSIKTGMLMTAANVAVVAEKVQQHRLSNLVVDPVFAATSGAVLLKDDAIDILRRRLLPQALLVTPNIDEVRILTGVKIRSADDMEEAALQIHGFGAKNVYIKGGHLEGEPVDVFFDGKQFVRLHQERIDTRDSHGTGCVLSAALAAYLARGESLSAAVRYAKEFVTAAIRNSLRLGSGRGPCDPVGIL